VSPRAPIWQRSSGIRPGHVHNVLASWEITYPHTAAWSTDDDVTKPDFDAKRRPLAEFFAAAAAPHGFSRFFFFVLFSLPPG